MSAARPAPGRPVWTVEQLLVVAAALEVYGSCQRAGKALNVPQRRIEAALQADRAFLRGPVGYCAACGGEGFRPRAKATPADFALARGCGREQDSYVPCSCCGATGVTAQKKGRNGAAQV